MTICFWQVRLDGEVGAYNLDQLLPILTDRAARERYARTYDIGEDEIDVERLHRVIDSRVEERAGGGGHDGGGNSSGLDGELSQRSGKAKRRREKNM